jgi:hypothetical protein
MFSHHLSSETKEASRRNCEVFHIYVSFIPILVSNQAGNVHITTLRRFRATIVAM